MKALRFVLVAAAVAVASLSVAVPASANDKTGQNSVGKILPIIQCPRDGSIKLFKTADKSDYNLNDVVTFTLKVQAFVCDATGVMVHDQLPAGLTVSDPSVLNHNFGAIAAAGEKSFTFQAVAVAKGQWTNKAHAAGFSIGPDDPGDLCRFVRPPLTPLPPLTSTQIRVISTTYYCPKSSDAEVTINVTAASGNNPTPTPTPAQPPSNPGVPSLPNTGRQG
jgi:uncharacterized repeat protein (TIGR01451 family)